MFLVLSCSCLCPSHWSQVLIREWRCCWSNADRRCSKYIWVINKFSAYLGASYIRCLAVHQMFHYYNDCIVFQIIIDNNTCVFWDFFANKMHGNWSSQGCYQTSNEDAHTFCACDHLTNFAVLTVKWSRLWPTILIKSGKWRLKIPPHIYICRI